MKLLCTLQAMFWHASELNRIKFDISNLLCVCVPTADLVKDIIGQLVISGCKINIVKVTPLPCEHVNVAGFL